MTVAHANAADVPLARKSGSKLKVRAVAAVIAAGLALLLLKRRSRLPDHAVLEPGRTRGDTSDTFLGRAIGPLCIDCGTRSGVHALPVGLEAFAARIVLANLAERSLDVQYYIWAADRCGTLLVDALRGAAERGVQVRMLIDDFDSAPIEEILAALATLPNFEVRIFNPFVIRRGRWLGFLTDFPRLNRRMHNKAFTADDQATIIGGRNIGDRYFDAARGRLFMDLDVLAIGPAVQQVSSAFDLYWNSASAFPANLILAKPLEARTDALRCEGRRVAADPETDTYLKAVRDSSFITDLQARRLAFEWAEVTLLSDDPAKVLGHTAEVHLMSDDLGDALGNPQRELGLVSGYFVPTPESVARLIGLARRGVAVSIYTNAWDASDVRMVHAAYAKYRKQLLAGGVRLFEIRGGAAGSETEKGSDGSMGSGSSGGSVLHAKTFTADRKRVFIGSFNLDPRSVRLNTEQGLVIESSALADEMAVALATLGADLSYEVRLSAEGHLQWFTKEDGKVVCFDTEPGMTANQRLLGIALRRLPIDWMM